MKAVTVNIEKCKGCTAHHFVMARQLDEPFEDDGILYSHTYICPNLKREMFLEKP